MPSQRWSMLWGVCALAGVYFASSGLLKLDEVFFTPPTSASSRGGTSTVSVTSSASAPPAFDRLVIVLIDAMRADMVLGSDALYGSAVSTSQVQGKRENELSSFMPYTKSLLDEGVALGYVGYASVPTVTMPRLKALVTGKSPAFIDILKNFNSVELAEENLVQLLEHHGHRIVFYGDDTWLKLFPKSFLRHEGTSGFFTRDTVEVDNNVTRHLKDELDPQMHHAKSHDWDVLVVHYLGLDHVGHLKGPRSPLMREKLEEMDGIVKQIREAVREQDKVRREKNPDARPSLVLLCSDHGMSEVGNHGGATVEESSALMMFIREGNGRVPNIPQDRRRRMQVDLVPTLALLFGVAIPAYSTGLLIDELVADSFQSTKHHSQALIRNLQQLYALARIKFHSSALRTFDAEFHTVLALKPDDDGSDFIPELQIACQQLQSRVLESDGSEYDGRKVAGGVALLLVAIVGCVISRSFLVALAPRQWSFLGAVLVVGTLLQVIALSSSSSIENEHATIFFFLTTFGVGAIISWWRDAGARRDRRPLVLLCGHLVLVRCLRSRNQVINFGRLNGIAVDSQAPGNEFANDDSLSILTTGSAIPFLPTEVTMAAIWIITAWKHWETFFSQVHKKTNAGKALHVSAQLIFVFAVICAALCARASDPEADVTTAIVDADTSARLVYVASLGLVGLSVGDAPARWERLEMACWALAVLLQRTANLPTLLFLCLELLALTLWVRAAQANGTANTGGCTQALLCLWLTQMSFFALGNSHLVTTIDISNSYHGLSGYSQGIVGLLTFINVYSGPLVCLLSVAQWTRANCKASEVVSTMFVAHVLRFAVYAIIVYFMRFHLFIWSVFAPKMLYEVVHCVVIITPFLVNAFISGSDNNSSPCLA